MLAHIWGHMHVAQVKKNGPASEEFSLVHFTGRSAPGLLANQIARRDKRWLPLALAHPHMCSARDLVQARPRTDIGNLVSLEAVGRNLTYLAIYAPAAVVTRNA